MNIKDRLTSYEPLFQHYYVEEVIDSHDNETIIRVKKDDYLQSVAYVKIISIYGHDLPVEELESQAKEMKESMLNSDHYEDDEQYLIEDNQANIIGIDLCILLDQEKYDEEMFESQDFSRLYDIGLYYYTNERGSCEIDFIADTGAGIIPVEVKAETNLKAKSLRTYYEKFKPEISVRTSMADYKMEEWLLNLPLYAVEKLAEEVNIDQ